MVSVKMLSSSVFRDVIEFHLKWLDKLEVIDDFKILQEYFDVGSPARILLNFTDGPNLPARAILFVKLIKASESPEKTIVWKLWDLSLFWLLNLMVIFYHLKHFPIDYQLRWSWISPYISTFVDFIVVIQLCGC